MRGAPLARLSSISAAATLLLAACGGGAAQPTTAPVATTTPAAAAAAASPSAAAAASPSAAAAASPAAKPAASPLAAASPSAAAVPSPSAVAGGQLTGTIKIVSSLPRTGSSKGQTDTIVNAIKMALDEAGNKVGGATVTFEDMDDATPARGAWDAGKEAENANKAASDADIMVYIGTF